MPVQVRQWAPSKINDLAAHNSQAFQPKSVTEFATGTIRVPRAALGTLFLFFARARVLIAKFACPSTRGRGVSSSLGPALLGPVRHGRNPITTAFRAFESKGRKRGGVRFADGLKGHLGPMAAAMFAALDPHAGDAVAFQVAYRGRGDFRAGWSHALAGNGQSIHSIGEQPRPL